MDWKNIFLFSELKIFCKSSIIFLKIYSIFHFSIYLHSLSYMLIIKKCLDTWKKDSMCATLLIGVLNYNPWSDAYINHVIIVHFALWYTQYMWRSCSKGEWYVHLMWLIEFCLKFVNHILTPGRNYGIFSWMKGASFVNVFAQNEFLATNFKLFTLCCKFVYFFTMEIKVQFHSYRN